MSTAYKHGDRVPSEVLASRLEELAHTVTQGREAVSREFTMRVPAEQDRDADLVLSAAAGRIIELEAALTQQQDAEVVGLVEACTDRIVAWVTCGAAHNGRLKDAACAEEISAFEQAVQAARLSPPKPTAQPQKFVGVTLDGCMETLFRIGEHLGIDYAQARKSPLAPSGVYINAIEARQAAQPQVPEGWKVTQNELPPEGVPVIGFNAEWADADFNPDGIRDCFRYGDGSDWHNCWWNDPCEQYETETGRTGHCGAPTHWMPRPSSADLLSAAKEES